uniref:Uncharacterized protein AlNc14C48G3869 n=1 Tax=Albugo laibachii Nc14 TaxID=890382 RepID=F0WB13_9STRA|nr:conserved hypothetical protein [Albugo laibachii Nc14]CCA18391.1 conserved hypothetical protein [Albugo laibachii Nc14]|eukprot:CCA18391.1 conserved hypothetical protein [Albugo laibachii Nc14]
MENSLPRAAFAKKKMALQKSIYEQETDQLLLHQTVVETKKHQLQLELQRLAKQRAYIRHENRKLRLTNALLDSEKQRFEASLSDDWFCEPYFQKKPAIILFIGGKRFDITKTTALKDPDSLLAALALPDAPVTAVQEGRWLFRHILIALRDNRLPEDTKLLRSLYMECEFWKLSTLQQEIEKVNLAMLMPIHGKTSRKEVNWWSVPPISWERRLCTEKTQLEEKMVEGDVNGESVQSKYESASGKTALGSESVDDWWLSSLYKGVDFNEMLSPKSVQQESQFKASST